MNLLLKVSRQIINLSSYLMVTLRNCSMVRQFRQAVGTNTANQLYSKKLINGILSMDSLFLELHGNKLNSTKLL